MNSSTALMYCLIPSNLAYLTALQIPIDWVTLALGQ